MSKVKHGKSEDEGKATRKRREHKYTNIMIRPQDLSISSNLGFWSLDHSLKALYSMSIMVCFGSPVEVYVKWKCVTDVE